MEHTSVSSNAIGISLSEDKTIYYLSRTCVDSLKSRRTNTYNSFIFFSKITTTNAFNHLILRLLLVCGIT